MFVWTALLSNIFIATVSGTCSQLIFNRMEHAVLGHLDAYIVDSETNGAHFEKDFPPSNLYFNDSHPLPYKAAHHILGNGHLTMKTSYELVPWGLAKVIATFDIWTSCDERHDKTEVYFTNCTGFHSNEIASICHDIGFINVSCEEKTLINNEHYNATLVADGTGIQRHDFICDGNSLSEMRFNPLHCLSEIHLPEKIEALKRERDLAQSLLTNLTTQLSEEGSILDGKLQEIKRYNQKIKMRRETERQLENELKNKPGNVVLQMKILETQNAIKKDIILKDLLTEYKDAFSVKFHKDFNTLLNTKDYMKNLAEGVKNAQRFLEENFCGTEIKLINSLMKKVHGVVSKIVTFVSDNRCQILYYFTLGVGSLLDNSLKAIPYVGPAIEIVQEGSICSLLSPDFIIPSTPIVVKQLATTIVEQICRVQPLLPVEAGKWVQEHLCDTKIPSKKKMEYIMNLLCGDLLTIVIDLVIMPAICPLKLGDVECGWVLGDTVCSNSTNTTSSTTSSYPSPTASLIGFGV